MPEHIKIKSAPSKPLHLEADSAEVAAMGRAIAELLPFCKTGEMRNFSTTVRPIGLALFEIGGHAAMQVAYYTVAALWADGAFIDPKRAEDDQFHHTELSHAWNGVGVWRS